MKHRKIHIVDEGRSYRRLAELLEDYPYDIKLSTDVETAMEEIIEYQPHLIIIDINIKDKRGIYLCQRLKVHEDTKNTMVVFMAVTGFPYMIAQAYKAGAKDFITKPFNPFETVLRIKSLMDLAIAQDDIKESRKKEKLALTEAEEASKIKSQFLAVMSHEIRTPLNAIIGFADILGGENLTEDHREMIGTIKSSSDVLLNIVNDILDITKIEFGQIELDETVFNLEDISYEAAEIARSRMKSDQVEMNVDILLETPFVTGDSIKIKQVLTNVLSNAVKFTANGEILLKIRNNGDLFEFSVSDTGIGMSPFQIEKIFTPFVQADSSTTRKFGGTGLGLSICKSYIDAMGGEISVESELGEGATFSFAIELMQEDDGSFGFVNKKLNSKVLLLDDNPHFIRTTSRDLQTLGADVEAYKHWNDIPEDSHNFDIALIDAHNEHYQKGSVLAKLKEKYGIVHAIALQNRIDKRFSDTLLSTGFDAFVQKPLRMRTLVKVLERNRRKKSKTGTVLKELSSEKKSLNILIAEDNYENQRVISRILKDLGHQYTIAENGKVALDLLEEDGFDLVIMDMQMPVMSGCEATTHIRKKFNKQDLPIIAMTANAMTHYRNDCLAHGMNEFIAKPVTKERIWFSLEKYKNAKSNLVSEAISV